MAIERTSFPGLDGANPLGLFAALGLLHVYEDRWRRKRSGPRPRMCWIEGARWHPEIHGAGSIEEAVDVVLSDAAEWEAEPALRLAYSKDGILVDPDAKGAILDLKPPPAAFRKHLAQLADRAAAGDRRSADLTAAFGTDVAVDGKGNVKPTAFHFTAGQQTFLGIAADVRRGLTAEMVREALVGPWRHEGKLLTFAYDCTGSRQYALRASNPAKEKRGGDPGADWLALLGLAAFPVFPRGKLAQTTCVEGRWKEAAFSWALWRYPAAAPEVRSFLACAGMSAETAAERWKLRGAPVRFQCSIQRSAQGGYGSFSPSRPV